MDFFRAGLKNFGLGGFKMDDTTANLVANFASGGIGMALDQISRTSLPSRRKDPPPPRPPCPFKVLGEKGASIKARQNVQDFVQIRDSCLQNGTLFEDASFPADTSSIYYSRRTARDFVWLRPTEIVEDPQLFVEGASRFDVQQGELGDCWLLAAMASLTLNPKLFHQVVPEDQSFTDNYAGIFHFRIWQYGTWVDVVVDDRLPTCDGKLVFLQSQTKNEFWSALLEKAYAKLHGGYEALKGGTTCEAMEDFTGGVSEMYEMNQAPPNLFKILLKAHQRSSLMSCAIEPDPDQLEAETPLGLIKGHAYSITSVKMMDIRTPRMSGQIPMIRIRNPWGNEAEWKGAWSDQSPEWQFIPEDEKEEVGLTFDRDGEFWMSFRDFSAQYSRLEIVNLNADSLEEEELSDGTSKRWSANEFAGNWVKGASAGGCRNHLATFHLNPQYRITLEDPDDDDNDDKCTVIVALMQKNRRAQRKIGLDCLTIGFTIYHLKNPDTAPKPLDNKFFKYNASVARSPSFINLREVSCRFKLPPGVYAIIPSTFEPNEEGEFILRVFSEKKNNMEENDEEVDIGEADDQGNTGRKHNKGKHFYHVKSNDTFDDSSDVVQLFRRVAGVDMEIDWVELQNVLNTSFQRESSEEFVFEGFSKDVCRSMIAMLDQDHSGKLGLDEFKKLWSDIQTWKNTFKLYDRDRSNSLSTLELRSALHAVGYRLNYHVLNALVLRYGDRRGTLAFDDFIMCAIKMKSMIEAFKERDPYNTKRATFTLDEWIDKTLYS
ncbi:calpain-B-like isoform X1 [Daphnia carinata]|uniref:calpain-B-like isoform X1 n=1 Tax=Daphnia carinata TaxID=120202 RepID=UPI00257A1103|nr:calpain-B-like isoform X1 [Daphnia carinata]